MDEYVTCYIQNSKSMQTRNTVVIQNLYHIKHSTVLTILQRLHIASNVTKQWYVCDFVYDQSAFFCTKKLDAT